MKRNLFLGLIFTTIFAGANALVYGQTTVKAKQNSTAKIASKKSDDKEKKQMKETLKAEKKMEKQQMKEKQTAVAPKDTTKKKRKKFLGIF